ncbi:MAG TPA: hypothetical protein VME63_08425 [Dyella sp.]|uniref:hypothetical protein n=1 Tax=Dyella sp. TaxID=1869338 RepID=UPI002D075A97|nr:hypothetical protein [Dyella sp.]HTV85417.1 hypothetical protein [Dyella sp.]
MLVLIGLAAYGIPAARILSKAGYSSAWLLIMFVPLLNVVMFWVFAFVKWPIED